MPFAPPWATDGTAVRDDYAAGLWAYALGRPAREHPRYADAVRMAEAAGWNPWWLRSWGDVPATLDGCYLDEAVGRRACDFFPRFLRHSKGRWAGEAFELMDWQKYDVTIPLFGWRRPDGTRRFRTGHIEIPKKNGKSTWCAGVGLLLLVGDGEPGPEVYSAAVDREQAGIIHGEAARMVRQSPALRKHLKTIDNTKTIRWLKGNGIFRALSAETSAHEGLNIHGALIDEIHVHKDRRMWDVLRYGGAARTQPLLFAITTAGVFDALSIGWEQHTLAMKLLDGSLEQWAFFPYVAGAQEEPQWGAPSAADWLEPETWRRANPSWDLTIAASDFAEEAKEAASSLPKQNSFKRYRLNIWTRQSTRWIDIGAWNTCRSEIADDAFAGAECYGGLDLSETKDFTAFSLCWPIDGTFHLRTWFWLPQDNILQLGQENQAPYLDWARTGHMHLTPGERVDYGAVEAFILEATKKYAVREIAFDPFNAFSTVANLLTQGVLMIEQRQGYQLNQAIKAFEASVVAGKIQHSDHPILNWHVSNCEVEYNPQGYVKLVKADGKVRYRIDGAIASVMAFGRAHLHTQQQSVYEDGGLFFV